MRLIPVVSVLMSLLTIGSCAPPPEVRWLGSPASDPLSDPALHPATQQWGPLIVTPGVTEVDTGSRPWSGFWYPLGGKELNSPLAQYDRASGKQALKWQTESQLDSGEPALPWEGRCDAWAFASILIPEPSVKRVVGGVEFETWEQKALWILSFEKVDPQSRIILGNRNFGDGRSPFEDLLPMEFHKALEKILRDERKALILDRDPRPPVWNTPIWGARWEIQPSQDPRWWIVSTDLYGVLPLDSPSSSASERRAVVLHYDYRLRVELLPSGEARVLASEWIGASKSDHPDFLTILVARGVPPHRSENPEIDPAWLESNLK